MGTLGYQWKADGVNISGATAGSFQLTQAQVGKAVSVIATYTDGFGTTESVVSSATTAVVNVNDAPTGSVMISGDPQVGQYLVTSHDLNDTDGFPDGGAARIMLDFEWQSSVDRINWSAITDAGEFMSISQETTSSGVLLDESLIGQSIRVIASYTDALGTYESVASIGTVLVQTVPVIGTAAADRLVGSAFSDMIDAGDGHDYLDGGSGADTLIGGAGNDFYCVDHAGDSVIEFAGQGIDTVSTRIDFSLPDHVENLLLNASVTFRGPRSGFFGGTKNVRIDLGNDGAGNGEDNLLVGNRAANELFGGAGADRLVGGAGSDTLIGGAGSDVLIGGAGADVFVFDVFDDGSIDRITDFGAGDVIRVVGGGTVSYDATTGALSLGAVQFAVLNGWSGFVMPTWLQIV